MRKAKAAISLISKYTKQNDRGATQNPVMGFDRAPSGNSALKAMGYDTRIEMTGHGFRAMVYTPPREKLKYPKGVVDFQLAHGHGEDCYKGAHA